MGQLVLRLFDILRLRSGPQDLPAGWVLATVLSLAYIVQGLITDRLLGEADSVPRSLIAITVQFFVIAALLHLKKLSHHLPQTISALAGTGLLFGMLSFFLVFQADPEKNQPGLALVWFGVFLWSIAVDAGIYRYALSIKMNLGILVAVMIFALNFILLENVLG
jgi:hypothetical protein